VKKSHKTILVIGSGPIVIGQAAEFDYSGTQACKMLKKEGIKVILVNNNPATIMTDTAFADAVYLEPLTVDYLEAIIVKERPDGVLVGMGGQSSLNLATKLHDAGIFQKYGVEVLGTDIAAIKESEDREAFKKAMERIGEPVIESGIGTSLSICQGIAKDMGYPLVLRPAYTLGGSGGSIVEEASELDEKATKAMDYSPVGQVLIERSVYGWKEIEYEVVRDAKGNCIIVCNMENIDPVGIHTGDSIVVAPSQTLSDKDHQMLRSASIKIVSALNIVGACNVQFALSPDSFHYFVIEVNPRVSRSSALASKATGYPIAKVATKIALGYSLDEIINEVTQTTMACFEPALDYCVVKIPRWPFDQLSSENRQLGTSMMATGEVMSIGNNFENALMKAVRSLELGYYDLTDLVSVQMTTAELEAAVKKADDKRLFHIAELMKRGHSVGDIHALSAITPYFLEKIKNILDHEKTLSTYTFETLTKEVLTIYKKAGLSDKGIARLLNVSPRVLYEKRLAMGLLPSYKMVDTCSGEFEAYSNYYYSSYDTVCESTVTQKDKVVVIGSGPIRIGQGVEFDYCSVHGVLTLKKLGYEAIIINNNPETVSTDFDISDKLYFEPITEEDVLNILTKEKPLGVILQYGGQTAIKLAEFIHSMGIPILGTSFESIDQAEDRKQFEALLEANGLSRPLGKGVWTQEEAIEFAESVGFPVLVRPSYVIGGTGMKVVWNLEELKEQLSLAMALPLKSPLLIDQYIDGMEIEVDALSDGEDILIPGIMEHLEKAGVHSGDSSSIYPARLSEAVEETLILNTQIIAKELGIVGILNIQFILSNHKIYIIEVNPRASRTVPFLSKITGLSMIEVSTELIMGKKLKDLPYGTGLMTSKDLFAIKTPIFSMEKIPGVDTILGPLMKSTGETMSIGKTFEESMYKSFIVQGFGALKTKGALVSIGGKQKEDSLAAIRYLADSGFDLYATEGTKDYLAQNAIASTLVNKIDQGDFDCLAALNSGKIGLVVNMPTGGLSPEGDGLRIRRKALELRIPCVMNIEKLDALQAVLASDCEHAPLEIFDISDLTLQF
jgi:carbamoyl-phosphate synthase large subunit